MKTAQLIQKMTENGVKLPDTGSGRNGKILNKDLETALGDYFFKLKYANDPVKGEHCWLRRKITPMKAYRYDHLKPIEQDEIFKDSNNWVGEEKYNGWRMIITYLPGDGFCFWGGNISDVDFLPVDYTDHILLSKRYRYHPRSEPLKDLTSIACVLDTEALSYDDVETLDGLVTNNTLDAIGAILGSGKDRALQLQDEGVSIEFVCFDALTCYEENPKLRVSLQTRQSILAGLVKCFSLRIQDFKLARKFFINKKQTLNTLWKQGKEGMIFKHLDGDYIPGGRHKTHAIKVKRTMSGEIGDDIDAFISGWIETPEHSKAGLIGGLELSVLIDEGPVSGHLVQHHIATVTGMPDHVRQQLTECVSSTNDGENYKPYLAEEFMNKVVVVDGQELSNRNRKLMHARIDWDRGFRPDKNWQDCIIELETLEEEKF